MVDNYADIIPMVKIEETAKQKYRYVPPATNYSTWPGGAE
jgi:hypothetical protein